MDFNIDKNNQTVLLADSFKYFGLLPIGILYFNENLDVVYVNENLKKFGLPGLNDDSELHGNNLLSNELFMQEPINAEIQKLKGGAPFEREIKNIKAVDGREISIILKGTSFFEDGILKGGFLIVEDLSIIPRARFDESLLTKDFFEQVLLQSYSIVLILDVDCNVKLIGGRDINQFTSKKGNLVNKHISTVLYNDIAAEVVTLFNKSKRDLQKQSFLVELQVKGELKQYSGITHPVIDGNNNFKHVYLFFNDITPHYEERKKYKNQIEELRYYQTITETATDAVVGLDLSGKIVFWNKSADLLFGYTRSEVYGKLFGKVTKAYDEISFAKILTSLEEENNFKVKLSIISKTKEKKTCDITFSTTWIDGDNKVIIVVCTDITEKENVEKSLRLSEDRFRNIVQKTAELICNYNSDGIITYANPSFCSTLGYSEEEILKKNISDLIAPQFIEQKKFNQKNIYNAKTYTTELAFLTSSGDTVFVLGTFSISKDIDESKKVFSGIFTDITQKKEAEQELSMMRRIFEASNDGIAIEKDGKFILTNDSFLQLFGYKNVEELIDTPVNYIATETDREKFSDYMKKAVGKDLSVQCDFLAQKKDGSKFYAEISTTSFEFDTKSFSVILARDITERKRTQQAIKDSEEKYRSITENLDDFFWMAEQVNNKLKLIFFTQSVQKITGRFQVEYLKNPRLIFKIIYPDDFLMVKNKLKNLFVNYYKNMEEMELRIVHKAGNIVWIRNKTKVIRDKDGVVQKMYGLVSDISLEKHAEAEIKKTADDLKKLNDAKDKFISIISHDLRTPFSSILGFTDMLLNDDELTTDERKQYVSFIKESSESMLTLVNSILDWTRVQTGRIRFEPQKIAVNKIVRKAINSSLGFAMKKDINLRDELTDEYFVFIDAGLILQVINNLVSNALKFTPPGGVISISAVQSPEPRFIEITVADSGVGIAPENISKIFSIESKFTTEGTAGEKGTGFGLSLVKEIVEKHGGRIRVESELGKGTKFKFILPKASAKILLIDDSNTDRILYSKLLKSIVPGYEIITAKNGAEGFDSVVENSPALVVTDHVMPEMDGYQFVKKLVESEIKGKPPVIVLSADIRKGEIVAYNELGIEYIFQKPVNLNTLKDAIEQSLKKFTI